MKTRFQGTCPICFNTQVVKGSKGAERLVLHGYIRPNTGWIHGSCPGVGKVCFERSPEATRNYVDGTLKPMREAQVAWLTKVSDPEFRGTLVTEKRERVKSTSSVFAEWKTVAVEVPYDENPWSEWARLRTREVNKTTHRITGITEHISEFEARISGWTAREPKEEAAPPPKPPTVHARSKQFGGAICSSRWGYGANVTSDHDKVTCSRCLKRLGARKAS